MINEIIAIDNKKGLYKIVGILASGLLAESLTDGKRIPVLGDNLNITVLNRSAIHTRKGKLQGKLPLPTLFKKMHEQGTVPEKTSDEQSLKNFFTAICPERDEKRFHLSDMRQIAGWYAELKDKMDFSAFRLK